MHPLLTFEEEIANLFIAVFLLLPAASLQKLNEKKSKIILICGMEPLFSLLFSYVGHYYSRVDWVVKSHSCTLSAFYFVAVSSIVWKVYLLSSFRTFLSDQQWQTSSPELFHAWFSWLYSLSQKEGHVSYHWHFPSNQHRIYFDLHVSLFLYVAIDFDWTTLHSCYAPNESFLSLFKWPTHHRMIIHQTLRSQWMFLFV